MMPSQNNSPDILSVIIEILSLPHNDTIYKTMVFSLLSVMELSESFACLLSFRYSSIIYGHGNECLLLNSERGLLVEYGKGLSFSLAHLKAIIVSKC